MKLIPDNLINVNTRKFNHNGKTLLNIICESKDYQSDLMFESGNNFDEDVYSTLIEKRAFASALLYLFENTSVLLEDKEDITNLKEDVNELLHMNTDVINEQAPLLTTIGEYPLFESNKFIIRGNGNNKLLEYFDDGAELSEDLKQAIEKFVASTYEGTLKNYGFGLRKPYLSDAYLNSIYHDVTGYIIAPSEIRKKMEDYYKKINSEYENKYKENPFNEEAEGTQVSDIAPKTGYGDLTKPKSKYDDSLVLDLNENTNIQLKGFVKNTNGQYVRGDYVLLKEGANYKVVNKNKLIRS